MKKILGLATALSLLLVPVFSVQAAETTSDIGVNGGTLSIPSAPTSISFPAITLDGLNWKYAGSDVGTVRVTDGRGTGEGWNLSVGSTQFQQVGGQGLTLPLGTLYMYAPTSVSPVWDTDSPAPVLATGGRTIDDGTFVVATAAANTGLGTYDISFPSASLEINLPPSVKVVDKINHPTTPTPYETTITWTLNNTP